MTTMKTLIVFAALAGAVFAQRSSSPGLTTPNGCPVLIGANQLCVKGAPYYASGSAQTTTTSGTFGIGTSGTLSSCIDFAANEGILIAGAGSAGGNYVGTVVFCNGTTLKVTPGTSTSVVGALVQHDDSAGFQTAITALASTGGRIFVPDGTYLLNGSLQGAQNAVLMMPSIPYFGSFTTPPSGTYTPMISIEISGLAPAPMSESYLSSTTTISTTGAILQTSVSGALIAGYETSGIGQFTNVRLTLRNLTFRTNTNPVTTVIQATQIAGLDAQNVNFDTTQTGIPIQPTNSTGIAVVMPHSTNSTFARLRDVEILGYYTGVQFSENAVLDNVNVMASYIGFLAGNGPAYGALLRDVHAQGCVYGLYANSAQKINVLRFNTEHQTTAAWMAAVADVYDPNNYLQGSLVYDNAGTFLVTGAEQLEIRPMKSSFFPQSWNGLFGFGPVQNFLTYGSTFTNAVWTKPAVTVTGAAGTAPDNTTTASHLTESATNALQQMYQTYSASATNYTFSVYAKAAEARYLLVRFDTGNGYGEVFDLTGGTFSLVPANQTLDTGLMSPIGNGWYRCSVTLTATATTWYAVLQIVNAFNSGAAFSGDGSSGVYIWGAQLDSGVTPLPLAITNANTVNRTAAFTAPNITW